MQPKRKPPVGAQRAESCRDVLVEAPADARLEADTQELALLGRAFDGRTEPLLPAGQQFLDGRKQGLACGCELDAAPVPAKECKAELSFELADLLGERRLGHVEAFRCA